MNQRTILFASLVILTGLISGGISKLNADEPAPGPSDKDAPKEFTETDSGLKYRILRKSNGQKPTIRDMVKVNYKGWLDGGKEFDSTYKPDRTPFETSLRRVVAGWTEGMQLVGKGGMIELEIPYELGYGEKGAPPDIPPKATLHFIVEMLDVLPALEPGKVDDDAPKEFTTTKSGLKYRIRRKATGRTPTRTNSVTHHFRLWMDEDKDIDSTYEQRKPLTIAVQRIPVKGWSEGVQLIGKGGMIELEIPPELAFGDLGRPPMFPPKATLHMLIEVLEVK